MPACGKCGKPAVTRLAYNKTDLCSECFCAQFESRVKAANKDFRLFSLDQRTAVGVSGGKDSSAMLYVLAKKIVPGVHGARLFPVLIDEGIQGYRSKAREKAEQLCDELYLDLKVYAYKDVYLPMDEVMAARNARQANDAEFQGRKACTYCGVFRKSLLNKAALDLEADALAIGHNADDIAQTFLMNLMHNEAERHTRFEIANERKAGFVPRIKPLVYNLEKEAALYCELQNLPYYRGACPYSDESFRGEVKHLLNEMEDKNPGVKFNLVRSFLELQEKMNAETKGEKSGLGQAGNGRMKTCARCGQNASQSICQACTFVEELSARRKSTELSPWEMA